MKLNTMILLVFFAILVQLTIQRDNKKKNKSKHKPNDDDEEEQLVTKKFELNGKPPTKDESKGPTQTSSKHLKYKDEPDKKQEDKEKEILEEFKKSIPELLKGIPNESEISKGLIDKASKQVELKFDLSKKEEMLKAGDKVCLNPPDKECYEVKSSAGKGGMGATWKVEKEGKPFILKFSFCDSFESALRNLKVYSMVKYKQKQSGEGDSSIMKVYGMEIFKIPKNLDCLEGYTTAYVVENIDGVNLHDFYFSIKNRDPTVLKDISLLVKIIECILKAVNNYQKYELFHFDIKPENLMVRKDKSGLPCVVIDFDSSLFKTDVRPIALTEGYADKGVLAIFEDEEGRFKGKQNQLYDSYSVGAVLGVILDLFQKHNPDAFKDPNNKIALDGILKVSTDMTIEDEDQRPSLEKALQTFTDSLKGYKYSKRMLRIHFKKLLR